MYMRYWNLTQNPPQLNTLPDLKELLERVKDDGSLPSHRAKGGGSRKRKAKSIKEKDTLEKKSKTATLNEEDEDSERDAEGETDFEEI
jgi:hypothetical protein